MAKKTEKIDYHEHDELPESLNQNMSIASATETTGMLPTPPQNSAERKSYNDLVGMAIPKAAPGKDRSPEKRHTSENGWSKYYDSRA